MAASFKGTWIASSFFVRGMSNIRPSQSTMSHVSPYWLPLRIPVLIATSNFRNVRGPFRFDDLSELLAELVEVANPPNARTRNLLKHPAQP